MADPKLLSIIQEFHNRLEAIDGTGVYSTQIGRDVTRGFQRFNEGECPCCSVFLGPRSRESEIGERARYNATVIIEGHVAIEINDYPEDLAIYMLADIQRAIETTDTTIGGLVQRGISFLREEIFYPENAGNIVSCRVEYEIPHIRRYGDPVN